MSNGSVARNGSKVAGSKRKFGGNCHSTGPSLRPSRNTPDAKKLAIGASISRRRFMWVMKRGPLTVNTKSSGVSAYHWRQLEGRCSE